MKKLVISIFVIGILLAGLISSTVFAMPLILDDPFLLLSGESARYIPAYPPEFEGVREEEVIIRSGAINNGRNPSVELSWAIIYSNDVALGSGPTEYRKDDVININNEYFLIVKDIYWSERIGAMAVKLELGLNVIENIQQQNIQQQQSENIQQQQSENIQQQQSENIQQYSFKIVGQDSSHDETVLKKKESLGKVALNLRGYIKSTKEKLGAYQEVLDSEKLEIIEKLDEKDEVITGYLSEIVSIRDDSEVKIMKSKLKGEIAEIKPLVEKHSISIQKDKISNIIGKLMSLSGRLEKITSNLGSEDSAKVDELNSLIESANSNLNKAKKLYDKNPEKYSGEIISYLKQANDNLKQSFVLLREILSGMEKDVLYDLESENLQEANKVEYPINEQLQQQYIDNIYVKTNEAFELKKGQSAKVFDINDKQKVIIVTLDNLGETVNSAADVQITINYWKENKFIMEKDAGLFKDTRLTRSVIVGDYKINLIDCDEVAAKFMIERNN